MIEPATTSSEVRVPSLDAVEAKSTQLTSAVAGLMEEARRGSPEALTRVNALLDAGLQALITIIKPSNLFSLEVTNVALGTHVSFTIPKGMSGKMVLDLIEKANPRAHGHGVVWAKSGLLDDAGLENAVGESTKFTFTVCTNFVDKTPPQQESYLAANDLGPVPRWVLTVGAALFRDQNGFPEKGFDIGTEGDNGDLFKGKVVMTASGSVTSHGIGLGSRIYCDAGLDNRGGVVVAGSPLPNQKS